jgi:hypothetical protein
MPGPQLGDRFLDILAQTIPDAFRTMGLEAGDRYGLHETNFGFPFIFRGALDGSTAFAGASSRTTACHRQG